MAPNRRLAPHPLLTDPILYIAEPVTGLQWKHLQRVLSTCGKVKSKGTIQTKNGRKWWLVLFQDVFHAEMALATLQHTVIPDIHPPFLLKLYHSSTPKGPYPENRVLPQYVKSVSAPHPLLCSATPQKLFTYFRNAGPLVNVSNTYDIGRHDATVVVEYWFKAHASAAAGLGKNIDDRLSRFNDFTLRTFDPFRLCYISRDVDPQITEILDVFGVFGNVYSVHIVSERKGFVSFFDSRHAAAAISVLNGKRLTNSAAVLRVFCDERQNCAVQGRPSTPVPYPSSDRYVQDMPDTGATRTSERSPAQPSATMKPNHAPQGKSRQKAPPGKDTKSTASQTAGEKCGDQTVEEARRAKEALLRHLERRHQRKRVQEAEELAQMRRESARQCEDDQRGLRMLTKAAFDTASQKLSQAEHDCEEAKRVWLEAERIRIRLAQEANDAQEKHRSAREREALAVSQREKADREAAELRHARERAVAEEAGEDEETQRLIQLAISIRKMENLQQLYEQDRAARQRDAAKEQNRAQALREEKRRREVEERMRQEAEKEHLLQAQQEQKAREKREREERDRQREQERRSEYENAAAKERTRCLERDKSVDPQWIPSDAVAYLRTVSFEFDSIKFSSTQPLTFESVPWPILHPPEQRSLDAIQWDAVEEFFSSAQSLLNLGEYKLLVEKVQRRFHPDKWRARDLYNSVMDEALRERLETAVNIVSQAVTPIWRNSKSML